MRSRGKYLFKIGIVSSRTNIHEELARCGTLQPMKLESLYRDN